MFLGIIVNSLSVVFGGLAGTVLSTRLSEAFRENLNMVLGACAMTMGIASIIQLSNLPAVILSVIVGTVVGLWLRLGQLLRGGGMQMQRGVCALLRQTDGNFSAEQEQTLITAVVLFCASGTGIYGAIVAGMTGEQSILLSKSILDFVTALIFACILGPVTSVIAVPQFGIYLVLIFLARFIFPLCAPSMIGDFKSAGGILLLATGFRMLKLRDFPVAEMIPAMVVVMPISCLWTAWVVPFLA